VLSLDGGGILGIFTAALLAGLDEDLGHPVLDHFDLVVGTSTGGIIAVGLGAGMSPRDIVSMYASHMGTIFPGPRRLRSVRQLVRPKYRSDGLESLLREMFDDRLLGESRVPLVIPAFDLGESNVYIFKTPHNERLKRDWKVPFWQVAMATCAAPTFFPAYSLPDDHVRLVDGGVWANNPAAVGVAEAVSVFGQPLDSIRVLSLGTTAPSRRRNRKLDNGGFLQWLRSPNVLNVLLTGQSVGAFNAVQHLIGATNAYRLDPPAPPGLAKLDRADARDLMAKAAFHSRVFCPTFESFFADHAPAPYRPFHGPNSESR
jgi:patatin-like phospholipase/acyl hydrolase